MTTVQTLHELQAVLRQVRAATAPPRKLQRHPAFRRPFAPCARGASWHLGDASSRTSLVLCRPVHARIQRARALALTALAPTVAQKPPPCDPSLTPPPMQANTDGRSRLVVVEFIAGHCAACRALYPKVRSPEGGLHFLGAQARA